MFLSIRYDVLIIANRITVFGIGYSEGQGVAQGFDGCLSVLEAKATRKGQNGNFLYFSGPKLT